MDNIIKLLKNVAIEEHDNHPLGIIRTSVSCLHLQKCYIPPYLFRALELFPGEPVTLHDCDKLFILRAFPSYCNTNNIEVNGMVVCEDQKNSDHTLHGIVKVQPKKITFIDIDIVCNEKYLKLWLSMKSKSCSIIERRILKNVLFCVGSIVHFDTMPDTLTWGLRKLVIVHANTKNVGSITSRTKVNINQVCTEVQYQQHFNFALRNLFGVETILKQFFGIIDANIRYQKSTIKLLPPIKQVLLAGPSGCGKSSLVQVLSASRSCPLVRVEGQDASHKDPGQAEQELRNFFQEAFSYANDQQICIILLENIDILCPSTKSITPHTLRLTNQLTHLLDECQERPGIIVIATTNKPFDVSTSLRRHGRLAKEIFMGKPSEKERMEIISNFLDIFSDFTKIEKSEISTAIANITPGFLGADLKFLCQMACFKMSSIMGIKNDVNTGIQTMKDVLLGMKPASLRNEVEIVPAGTTAQTIGGLDKVKKQLELSVHCSLLQPHTYTRLGIQKPRGILLYGPPGCAKTSLVKTLASAGNITVLCASSASIYSPYVGDAEKAIVNLFHSARQSTPAIIFFDEIDSLVGCRYSTNDSNNVQERVLAALLTQMDGIGIAKEVADYSMQCADGDDVLVIAATNRPNEIDPALLRPGRFDRHIYVPPPDADSRLHILSLVTQGTPLDEDVDLEEIAKATEYFSGADLKNLHMESVLRAMEDDGVNVKTIRKAHYDAVLKITKPSLSSGIDEHFRNLVQL